MAQAHLLRNVSPLTCRSGFGWRIGCDIRWFDFGADLRRYTIFNEHVNGREYWVRELSRMHIVQNVRNP